MSSERPPWEIFEAEFITSAAGRQGYPREAIPQVAFAGRSNVGKSSLLNALVNRKSLARASQSPGLTQLINFFHVNRRWFYVDLPGYGYAKAPESAKVKWQRMIEEYLDSNPNLRLLILLLDVRRKPSPLDDQLVEFLEHRRIPAQIVLTKCDKLKRGALEKAREEIGAHYGLPNNMRPIACSTTKKMGRRETLEMLYEYLEARSL